MPLVLSDTPFTIDKYLREYFHTAGHSITSLEELRLWLDNNGYTDIWDKPLSEIAEVLEQGQEVVLVIDDKGNARWFEIP